MTSCLCSLKLRQLAPHLRQGSLGISKDARPFRTYFKISFCPAAALWRGLAFPRRHESLRFKSLKGSIDAPQRDLAPQALCDITRYRNPIGVFSDAHHT